MPIWLPPYVPPPPLFEYTSVQPYEASGGWDSISTNYFDALDRNNLSGEPMPSWTSNYAQLLSRNSSMGNEISSLFSNLDDYLIGLNPGGLGEVQRKLGTLPYANPATAQRVGSYVRSRIASDINASPTWNPSTMFTTLPAENVAAPGPDEFTVANAIVPYLTQAQNAWNGAQTLDEVTAALGQIVSNANAASVGGPSSTGLQDIYAKYSAAPFIQSLGAKFGDPGRAGASAPQPSLFHASVKKNGSAVTNVRDEDVSRT